MHDNSIHLELHVAAKGVSTRAIPICHSLYMGYTAKDIQPNLPQSHFTNDSQATNSLSGLVHPRTLPQY